MIVDLFNVVKCDGDTPDDGSAVEESLLVVNLVEIIVAITGGNS